MPLRLWTCLAAALLVGPPCAAEEKYAILFRAPDVGEPIRVEKEETLTTRMVVHDGLGRKTLDRQEKQVESFTYNETLLEKTREGGVGKLRRRYEKAQLKVDKSTRAYAFEKRTVYIRSEGRKCRFFYEGELPLDGADAAPLDREFNGGDEKFLLTSVLPTKPIPVGADWTFDMGPPIKDFVRTGRFAVDKAWATGSGHLTKATPTGGAQYGQVHLRMDIPIVAMAVTGKDRIPVLSGSRATFELSLDLCIDGSLPNATFIGTCDVKSSADLPQPGGLPGRVTFQQKCDSRDVRKLDKPEAITLTKPGS
jgi:hypothetical protein